MQVSAPRIDAVGALRSRGVPDTTRRFVQHGGERGAGRWKKPVAGMPMVRIGGKVPSCRIAGVVVSEEQCAS